MPRTLRLKHTTSDIAKAVPKHRANKHEKHTMDDSDDDFVCDRPPPSNSSRLAFRSPVSRLARSSAYKASAIHLQPSCMRCIKRDYKEVMEGESAGFDRDCEKESAVGTKKKRKCGRYKKLYSPTSNKPMIRSRSTSRLLRSALATNFVDKEVLEELTRTHEFSAKKMKEMKEEEEEEEEEEQEGRPEPDDTPSKRIRRTHSLPAP